jgi:hypothetical protein
MKAKVFDQCVLPVFTYGTETMTLTKLSYNKLRITQRKMKRIMLGIRLLDRKGNYWIRSQIKVTDVVETDARVETTPECRDTPFLR